MKTHNSNSLSSQSVAIDYLQRSMVTLSSLINYEVARRSRSQVPFTILAEFPRSGGNWVRDMLGDVLQRPNPRYSLFPITFDAIVQTHQHKAIEHQSVIYVVRDGRDVLLSHYHFTINALLGNSKKVRSRALKFHPSLQEVANTGDRSLGSISEFYNEWRVRPIGSRVNWGDHVTAWLEKKPDNVTVVTYDKLLANPCRELTLAVEEFTGQKTEEFLVEFSIKRNSFEYKTGLSKGQIVESTTARRGMSGVWREELSDELKCLFTRDFGKALKIAGFPKV